MHVPAHVKLVEVGPRDGLQNEAARVSTEIKIGLIERLANAGLPVVEAGSFVSPKWVPQMADTADVFAGIIRREGTRYVALTPNVQGLTQAMEANADEVAVFAAASETFSQKNLNCSIDASFDRFAAVCDAARNAHLPVRGYVSCVMGCPYEGAVSVDAVATVAGRLWDMGCYEISLGDTIGVGTPAQAQAVIAAVAQRVPLSALAAHFHDTYGQALANILAVLEQGVGVVDAAVAGLGGCPYARGATGNVATEDVLYMLNGLGVSTGVDLDAVTEAGGYISDALGRPPVSKVSRALTAKRTG